MNKKAIFIFILIIIFCICFYIGFTFQREDKQNDIIKNDMVFDNNESNVLENEVLETSAQDEKTTPHTILILKKYYLDCGHTISDSSSIPEEMINLSKEEIQQMYENWEIESFSKDEVVLKKTLESFCGEHYYVTEEDGYISIYTVDEEENKTLKETGKVSSEYLPETDRITLKNGIMVYGTEELNKLLEDYE